MDLPAEREKLGDWAGGGRAASTTPAGRGAPGRESREVSAAPACCSADPEGEDRTGTVTIPVTSTFFLALYISLVGLNLWFL